ncbi:MAG TPA: energy transducer TonB [Steroidobacteraceae bacterium]|nr:energy transducer TonB [Steroidobacteraceae bacterium]
MTTYLPRNEILSTNGLLSRRAVTSAGIVVLHGLAAYLLATGMIHTSHPGPPQDIEVLNLPGAKTPPAPPPPSIDTRDFKPREVVAPDQGMPQYEAPDALSAALPQPVTDAVPSPKDEPIRLVGHHQLPNTADVYPPELRRQGVEGAADVRVCVDEHAAIQGAPSIERSSGDPRLDQGAINVVLRGRYALAMRGDTPVPNCYRFRIAFRLQKGFGAQ